MTTPLKTGSLCKRIIPCLDVDNGRTVKGVKFQNLREIGDPVALGLMYQEQGADELLFLDITATHEGRETLFSMVEKVADNLMIPFTVGGGVGSVAQAKRLLACGADKIAVNSAAVKRPELIREIAEECGSQCCVLAIDARKSPTFAKFPPTPLQGRTSLPGMKLDSSSATAEAPVWEVLIQGGRLAALPNALAWAQEAVALGAGEILLTSWDQDGTRSGFDIALTRSFAETLPIPVIASGGASGPESFISVFTEGKADAALAASIFHDRQWTVDALKAEIAKHGIPIRI